MTSTTRQLEGDSRLRELVENMARALLNIDVGDTWTGLTCAEFDAIYAVLVEAGQEVIAHALLDRHADGDDEGDSHWLPPPHAPAGTARE